MLKELKAGDKFNGFAIVKDFAESRTKNNETFYSMVLADKSGSLQAKVWPNVIKGTVKIIVGEPLHIVADVTEFRGNKQLKIANYRNVTEQDDFNIDDLIKSAPYSENELKRKIYKYLENMDDFIYKAITTAVFEEYKQEYMQYPAAAKNHHAFKNGLAYHVVSMLQVAESIANIENEAYATIDKDLLYAGVILHDVAKVMEYSGYENTQVTIPGMLLGHIPLGAIIIHNAAKKLKSQLPNWSENDHLKVMKLQHLVLSHHGKQEWGSPVVPHLLESELLHHIDMIDSRVNMITEGLKNTEKGQAEKIYPLGTYLNI